MIILLLFFLLLLFVVLSLLFRIFIQDQIMFSKIFLAHSHLHVVFLHRDVNILAAAWTKAAEIAIKFLDTEKATGVAGVVGPRLVEFGRLDTCLESFSHLPTGTTPPLSSTSVSRW